VLIGPASLLSLLKAIYHWEDETIRQKGPAQSFSTMNTHPNPNLNMRSTNSNNQEREEIPTGLQEVNLEDISIHFLCTYSTHPNWTQIISTRNDYGQTLAHIAVTLGYFRLLQHLSRWKIDLTIVDSMGLSALHYAYLFKQEECAKILIHSDVDRFILDELGRSPADLDPSLEVGLRSIMEMEMDSSADGAPPIERDTEMSDEAGKLYAEHFLIQQWVREGEDEGRGKVPPADERVRGVTYERSSLGIHTPEKDSTLGVAEGIDLEALIKTGTPPHITYPPSPICEVSSHTQEANRPPDTGQNPFSHLGPLGGAIKNTPDLEDDVKEQNNANDGELLQRLNSRLKITSVTIPDLPRTKRRLPPARPRASRQQPISDSTMEPADAAPLYSIRKGEFVRDHPHVIEPCIIILGAYNARQTDAALPTAEMSSRQTLEAGATRQPAESTRTFSSGHSTTAASIGASTDNLRHSPRPGILALGEVGVVGSMRDPIEAVLDRQDRQVEGFKQTGLRKRGTPGVTWELPPGDYELSDELLTKPGALGVVRPNEESFKYAAKMSVRRAAKVAALGKAGAYGGGFLVSRRPGLKFTFCVGNHEPGHAVSTSSTLAPPRSCTFPFANLVLPSFAYAAAAASQIGVVPHSPAHLPRSSPPFSPTRPALNEQNDAECTARET